MFLLRCPKCKKTMKYAPIRGTITGKTKKCVYCGHSFKVKDRIIRRVKP